MPDRLLGTTLNLNAANSFIASSRSAEYRRFGRIIGLEIPQENEKKGGEGRLGAVLLLQLLLVAGPPTESFSSEPVGLTDLSSTWTLCLVRVAGGRSSEGSKKTKVKAANGRLFNFSYETVSRGSSEDEFRLGHRRLPLLDVSTWRRFDRKRGRARREFLL